MALTPEVRSSQAGTLSLVEGTSPELRASQLGTMVLGAFPTEELRASQAGAFVLVAEHTKDIRASQAASLVLARGRILDPRVIAWTFTLDGHDFYVLNIGDLETLIFDVSTGEWYTWGSDDLPVFQGKVGINWTGIGRIMADRSNVLVGHDSAGTVYLMNPDGDLDDHPTEETLKTAFRRRITAQFVVGRGYDFPPCYGVQLYGSIGQNGTELPDADLTVELEYSDDRGNSWQSAGTLSPPDEDFDFRLQWTSLGSMQAPGRLFRVIDEGALKRIDGFEIELPDEDE